MSYTRQLQAVANEYFKAHPDEETTARDIARWAITTLRVKPRPDSAERQLADELSRAMREEYKTDPQGRRVRAKHVARRKRQGKQLSLWADMSTASVGHMKIAFQQRRQQIVGDCHQLQLDVDSFNENRNAAEPIQIAFDFRNDLAELELLRRQDVA